MDNCRFDGLARMAASGASRRTAIQTLLAGGAGALAAVLDERATAAKGCRRLGGKCVRRKECCEGAACNNIIGCGLTGTRCCSNRGSSCTRNCDCCLELECIDRRCG